MDDKGTIENFEHLKPGEGVEGYEYAADLHADGTPLEDSSQGKTVSIRVYEFKMNPEIKEFPDRQTLFNSHAKQITTLLWGDGLMPLDGVAPRVIIDQKNKSYKIFIPAEANRSNLFIQKPKTLSEQLHGTPRH